MDKPKLVPALRRELEEAIIHVNYHFQSGYERHVTLQKPESIFLNFLKKKVTLVPPHYLMRIKNRDFYLTMSKELFVDKVAFTDLHWSHYSDMIQWLEVLNDAQFLIDYEELKAKSHTLDKFYQQTDKIINSIKDYKFN